MRATLIPAVFVALTLLPAAALSVPSSPYFDYVLDEGVFTLYAAMNAHGYDVVTSYFGMHPVRTHVREAVGAVEGVHEPLHLFAEVVHEMGHTEYLPVWYALHSDGPPDFGLSRSGSFSRETQAAVKLWEEGAPALAEFYRAAGIHALWEQVRPDYESAAAGLAPVADRTALRALALMGIRASGGTPLKVTVMPNLLMAYGTGHRLEIEGKPTVVLGPQTDPDPGIPVRALLEVVLKPGVEKQMLEIRRRGDLFELVRDLPQIQSTVRTFPELVSECLVWAVWIHVSGQDPRWVQGELERMYAQGYILVKVFSEQLEATQFESPSDLAAAMIAAVDVGRERERWEQSAPTRQMWLDVLQADLDRRQGRPADARILYDKILEADPGNARGLYGFGSLLFTQENYEEAKKALRSAAEANADEPWVEAWSWIRIGWIEDLEGNRDAALDAYRRAVETGDNYLEAQAIARQGLEQPYSGR